MDPWEYELEQDLNWREAELASLKVLVAEATAGTVSHQALLRALWAMLYAHYEGFCKFSHGTPFLTTCRLPELCAGPVWSPLRASRLRRASDLFAGT